MHRSSPRRLLPAAALVLLAAGAAAQPYPQKYVLPVAPVLAHPATQRALEGMQVRFGAPPAESRAPSELGTELRTLSWARPTDTRGYGDRINNPGPDGRPMRLTEEQTCQLALRYTLAEMAQEARKRGGQSIVDIVSFTADTEFNSPTMFECTPSHASSTVSLRGRVGGALAAGVPAPVVWNR